VNGVTEARKFLGHLQESEGPIRVGRVAAGAVARRVLDWGGAPLQWPMSNQNNEQPPSTLENVLTSLGIAVVVMLIFAVSYYGSGQ